MKKYQCHKVVEAAKIESVGPCSPDTETSNGVSEVTLEGGEKVNVDSAWLAWHQRGSGDYTELAGSYFVRYSDGYSSVSPASAFEEGYTEIV